ncbi:response regulator transcription factor [Aquibacillus kalidii]|uniref:response regulator transcription factor n=1 Tax=Aquibacillus kalidii TaxID=2762597 RepID=UPI00164649CD|nr:response regulator transcription factor [Aquibacillus kalidii]
MGNQEKILIIEDDHEIARILSDYLRKDGYLTTWASTGVEGWEEFKQNTFDLLLIDLMLPEMDGFTLCNRIRLESEVPLLIISAKQEDEAKIQGLNLGADDYLTKPFSLEELKARVNSHLRRYRRYHQVSPTSKVSYPYGLVIDFANKMVFLNGVILPLTVKELDLLFLLANNPLQTFTKAQIYQHIWGQAEMDGNNTVTVHIKGLRSKLNDQIRSAKYIQTVWGEGYRFVGEPIQ